MRRLWFVAILCIAVSSSAFAGPCPYECPDLSGGPWPVATSTIPMFMRVGGFGPTGQPDPATEFEVVVRDLANNPIPNALVCVDLGQCAPAVVCGVWSATCDSLDAGAPEHRVFAVTDAAGRVRMRLAGQANNPGGGPVSGDGRARISVCGMLLGTVPVAFLDQNGGDGTGANDLSAWFGDFEQALWFARSDYDGNGALGANDISVWLGFFGSGSSALGCTNHP
ncbi:MAG: hypothetical protein U0704_06835 [Candidatus Eisenbacteria bacterium]